MHSISYIPFWTPSANAVCWFVDQVLTYVTFWKSDDRKYRSQNNPNHQYICIDIFFNVSCGHKLPQLQCSNSHRSSSNSVSCPPQVKGCVKVLKDQPASSSENLLNALRWVWNHGWINKQSCWVPLRKTFFYLLFVSYQAMLTLRYFCLPLSKDFMMLISRFWVYREKRLFVISYCKLKDNCYLTYSFQIPCNYFLLELLI